MLLRVFLLVLLPLSSFAQTSDLFGEGFQLSLTLKPSISRFFTLDPLVTAMDTFPGMPIVRSGRTVPRPSENVILNGQEVEYWYEPELSREARRIKTLFKLPTQLKLHYRFNMGLEISLGFAYEGYSDKEKTDDFDGLPNDFNYVVRENRSDYGAIISTVSYHFLRNKKIQPYLGFMIGSGISKFKLIERTRVFPGLEEEQSILPEQRFLSNTILVYELGFLIGAQCQLGKRWSVGVEGNLDRFLLPIPSTASLQLRYCFTAKQ